MNDKRRRGKKLRVWVHLQWFFENHTVRGTDPQVASCDTHAGRRKAFQCNNASQHSDKTRLFQNTVQKLHKMHASAGGGRPWDVERWTTEPTYGGNTAFHTQIHGASHRIEFSDQQHLLLRSIDPSKMKAALHFKALWNGYVAWQGTGFVRRTIFKQCTHAQTKLGFHYLASPFTNTIQ